MPTKRNRRVRHRTAYPDAIERLIRGERIEPNEANRQALIALAFFRDFPELAELEQAALDQLNAWEWRETPTGIVWYDPDDEKGGAA